MPKKEVFEYQGKFDVSDILSGLKQIESLMSKLVKSKSGRSMLNDVETQFVQIQRRSTELLAALEKGFSSTSEMKNFEKSVDGIQTDLLKIKNNLQTIAKTEIDTNSKNFKDEIAKLEKEIEKLKNSALNDLIKTIKSSRLESSNNMVMLAREGKLTKEVILDEIDKREEDIKLLKEQLELAKQQAREAELDKALFKAVKSKGSIGRNLIASPDTIFGLTKAYAGTNTDLRARGPKGGVTQQFNEEAGKVIDNEFKQSLTWAIQEGKTAAEAVEYLKLKLEAYGVTINNVGDLLGKFAKKIGDVNSAYKENLYNINEQDIESNKDVRKHLESIGKLEKELSYYNIIDNAIDSYNKKVQEADTKTEKFTNSANNNNEALEKLGNEASSAGTAINKWGDFAHEATNEIKLTTEQQEKLTTGFENIRNTILTFLSVSNIFYHLRQEIVNTYEDIRELDKAFGQIAMVTDYSIEDMWNKYDAYAQIANELGQTTLSVILASGLYFQQGLEEAEALELTESTMKLATLAGLDFEQATSLMTSAVRGFHMEMSEGEHVTDVYSELAAKAAADVEGIANAISRTAAIANSAGMEFETTSAMLTTMIEATQESPETLGTAMKTVNIIAVYKSP